ncbi:MAG: translation initiation factor IF-2 subunit gamma [Candidatus Diapherotrites archaeon]|nr:translation initiation factor IF-2 subunit gamma [Candidatus Diapherotrites archaeon]
MEKKHAPKEEALQAAQYAEQAVINIGMVGHVDHGKTSLTLALTGKWTDTHSEELKRGISIRLGYADVTFFKCSHCNGSEAYSNKQVCPLCGKKCERLRRVSFVDAPGHETLLTTMLSGAALMNAAILVIAANEQCPQPQTEEHLMALKIAGINNIVVAQNKVDLVEMEQAIENRKQIEQFLSKNGYNNVPIIPVAANFSTNIDLLIEALEKHMPTPEFDVKKPLMMYCARSFDINKPGTLPAELHGGVVGGTIIQGKAKPGDSIEIAPGVDGTVLLTKISSLSSSVGELHEAIAGGLIAIGTGLDPSLTQNDRLRGQMIGQEHALPAAVNKLQLQLNYIERLVTSVDSKIKPREQVVLTIGTMTVLAVVESMQGDNAKISLNNKAVVLPKHRITVSKKDKGRWRLVAYAIA